jgi:molecular chaperone GrpE
LAALLTTPFDQFKQKMDKSHVKEPQETQGEDVSENIPDQTGELTEVTKLKDELAEAKDKYLRLYSEFENFRRRTGKEKLEMIQSANEQLLKELLPILDDFARAEKSFKGNEKDAEGFALIQAKFKKVVESYGVKIMDVKKGTDFNPDLHEAIAQVESPDELQGKVVEVVENGYLLNDKVIRFAKVVVGS